MGRLGRLLVFQDRGQLLRLRPTHPLRVVSLSDRLRRGCPPACACWVCTRCTIDIARVLRVRVTFTRRPGRAWLVHRATTGTGTVSHTCGVAHVTYSSVGALFDNRFNKGTTRLNVRMGSNSSGNAGVLTGSPLPLNAWTHVLVRAVNDTGLFVCLLVKHCIGWVGCVMLFCVRACVRARVCVCVCAFIRW